MEKAKLTNGVLRIVKNSNAPLLFLESLKGIPGGFPKVHVRQYRNSPDFLFISIYECPEGTQDRILLYINSSI
jgi:hypothetical protein